MYLKVFHLIFQLTAGVRRAKRVLDVFLPLIERLRRVLTDRAYSEIEAIIGDCVNRSQSMKFIALRCWFLTFQVLKYALMFHIVQPFLFNSISRILSEL